MKKLIYVSSPLRGDIEVNLENAKKYSREVMWEGIPITPHLYLTTFLNEDDPLDRHFGIKMGLQLLELCQEMWVFADEVTEGMITEIKIAQELNIPIKFYNANREEIKYESLIINKRIGPGLRKIIEDTNEHCNREKFISNAEDRRTSSSDNRCSRRSSKKKYNIWNRFSK